MTELQSHDLHALAASLGFLDLSAGPTREEAMAASKALGSFARHEVMLAAFRGQPPWEWHPEDELLLVVEGEVVLTLLGASPETRILTRGMLFLVPRATWHRSSSEEGVKIVAVTPREGNRSSLEATPRVVDPTS